MSTTQKEATRAKSALKSLETQLKSLGINDVDIMDTEAVLDAVELTPEQAKSYKAAVSAVKAFDVAQSEDGMSLAINYVPDEQTKVDEDESPVPDEEDGEKSLQLAAANRRIKSLEDRVRKFNKLLDDNGGKVKTYLPGEVTWRVQKSKGATVFGDAERAHKFGLMLLADSDTVRKINPQRHAEATKSLGQYGQKAQATFPNSKGGSLVPDEFSADIINEVEEYGVARRSLRMVNMASDRMIFPRNKGGLAVYFPEEGGTLTASDLAFDNVTLLAKKATVLNLMSNEILADSAINLAEFVAQETARALAQKEDQCLFLGVGTSTYGGMSGLASYFTAKASDAINVTGAAASSSHTEDNLRAMVAKLPTRYHAGAKWHCTTAVAANVFDRLAGDVGGYGYEDIAGKPKRTFLGFPIEINEVMNSTDAASNDVVDIYLGDFTRLGMFGQREGVQVDISTDAYFSSDQAAMRAKERFDIKLHETGSSSTAGAVIALWQD